MYSYNVFRLTLTQVDPFHPRINLRRVATFAAAGAGAAVVAGALIAALRARGHGGHGRR